ncbi:hypothetical protein WJ92_02560 [Burkholderia ubonensis]|uniref:hypothetical protein n=1 Tax=Burkholderia ubonensis TaxID=101571 RepID=UPI000754ACAE|nr:hypothetical protein [Burkholderia ubonensis]KVP77482.1 hypothetical protein WJ92_02560 [Burkholderia ubonensis]
MAHRDYVRNGHAISIDVDEDSRGRWSWSYTIDGLGNTRMLDRPLRSEGQAMREAEHDANAKVDRMPVGDAEE